MNPKRFPKYVWRLLHLPPILLYRIGLGPLIGSLILLLTTKGRKSGKARVTPLQYEEIEGQIYFGSARGTQADWFKNIIAHPEVEIQVKGRRFRGLASPIQDRSQIADFIEIRLQRHPRMLGAILHRAGLSRQPNRAELEAYAEQSALVVVRENGIIQPSSE